MDALAYTLLQNSLLAVNGRHTSFAKAIETDLKGKIAPVLYVLGIGFAFVSPVVSDVLFVVVAVMWFIPDKRFEPAISSRRNSNEK